MLSIRKELFTSLVFAIFSCFIVNGENIDDVQVACFSKMSLVVVRNDKNIISSVGKKNITYVRDSVNKSIPNVPRNVFLLSK